MSREFREPHIAVEGPRLSVFTIWQPPIEFLVQFTTDAQAVHAARLLRRLFHVAKQRALANDNEFSSLHVELALDAVQQLFEDRVRSGRGNLKWQYRGVTEALGMSDA